jgi:hypothetical protein
MATAAATRPSAPVLSIPNYGSASPTRVNLTATRSPAKSVSVSSPPRAVGRACARRQTTRAPSAAASTRTTSPLRAAAITASQPRAATATASPPRRIRPLSSRPVPVRETPRPRVAVCWPAGRSRRPRSRRSRGAWSVNFAPAPGPVASPQSPSQATGPATTASEQTSQNQRRRHAIATRYKYILCIGNKLGRTSPNNSLGSL